MQARARSVVGLIALAVLCGCAGSANLSPPVQSFARSAPPPARERIRIREFSDLPKYYNYYGPSAIAAGPDGNLWVTDTIDQDYGTNVVVGIATSGKQQHAYNYPGVSTEGASFDDIVAGPDGALWITDGYNEQIVRMTLQGAFTNYPLTTPSRFASPFSITVGPDRALWFTATYAGGNAIGRITTGGRIKFYPLSAQTYDIAAGSDGALWFTEYDADRIGRITTHGKITEYTKGIAPQSHPYSVAPGPDGALWFTEAAGRIGRITTSGDVTEFSRGVTAIPFDIAAGPDGAMWFTEFSASYSGAKIGRISMQGRIHEYSRGLDAQSDPTAIAAGPDGRMWFVESAADKTGRVNI